MSDEPSLVETCSRCAHSIMEHGNHETTACGFKQGIGITRVVCDCPAFSPFRQVDESEKPKGEGWGVGIDYYKQYNFKLKREIEALKADRDNIQKRWDDETNTRLKVEAERDRARDEADARGDDIKELREVLGESVKWTEAFAEFKYKTHVHTEFNQFCERCRYDKWLKKTRPLLLKSSVRGEK